MQPPTPSPSNGGLAEMTIPPPPQPVGIYGWRKRCVYAFILILMVLVIVNIALTVWILRVLQFSTNGFEGIKLMSGAVHFSKAAEFSKPVYSSHIQSAKKEPLYVMSNEDIQMISMERGTQNKSKLVVGPNSVEATCDKFMVKNSNGSLRLKIEGDKLYLGIQDSSFLGDSYFSGSVSTPSVQSPLGEPLRVESADSKVKVAGTGGVLLKSAAGDINVQAQTELRLISIGSHIHLQSPRVYMKNIPMAATSKSSRSPSSLSSSTKATEIYQLCICSSGKVYKVPAREDCMVDPHFCGQYFP